MGASFPDEPAMSRSRKHLPLHHPRLWGTWLLVGVVWAVGQLPWNVLLWLGRQTGKLVWRVGGTRRRVLETNIALCFPHLSPLEQQQLAYRAMLSTGEALTETAGVTFNSRVDLGQRLDIHGLEHVQHAQQTGQGVLLLGMHFNTIDVGSRLLGKVLDFSVVYRPNNNPVIDWLIKRARKEVEHYIERDDLRGLVRHLRAGRTVWYAPDQDYGLKHAVFVPFFGVPAATITATSRIAKMSGAQVVPVAHYRLPGGRYRIEFGPALEHFPCGDDHADTLRINQTIEHYVNKAPEQYLWVHRRFKRQPDGHNPYQRETPP